MNEIKDEEKNTEMDIDVFHLTPENLIMEAIENYKKIVKSNENIRVPANIEKEIIDPKNQDIKDERETRVGFFRRLCLIYLRIQCKVITEQKIKTHYPWLKFSVRRVFGIED